MRPPGRCPERFRTSGRQARLAEPRGLESAVNGADAHTSEIRDLRHRDALAVAPDELEGCAEHPLPIAESVLTRCEWHALSNVHVKLSAIDHLHQLRELCRIAADERRGGHADSNRGALAGMFADSPRRREPALERTPASYPGRSSFSRAVSLYERLWQHRLHRWRDVRNRTRVGRAICTRWQQRHHRGPAAASGGRRSAASLAAHGDVDSAGSREGATALSTNDVPP